MAGLDIFTDEDRRLFERGELSQDAYAKYSNEQLDELELAVDQYNQNVIELREISGNIEFSPHSRENIAKLRDMQERTRIQQTGSIGPPPSFGEYVGQEVEQAGQRASNVVKGVGGFVLENLDPRKIASGESSVSQIFPTPEQKKAGREKFGFGGDAFNLFKTGVEAASSPLDTAENIMSLANTPEGVQKALETVTNLPKMVESSPTEALTTFTGVGGIGSRFARTAANLANKKFNLIVRKLRDANNKGMLAIARRSEGTEAFNEMRKMNYDQKRIDAMESAWKGDFDSKSIEKSSIDALRDVQKEASDIFEAQTKKLPVDFISYLQVIDDIDDLLKAHKVTVKRGASGKVKELDVTTPVKVEGIDVPQQANFSDTGPLDEVMAILERKRVATMDAGTPAIDGHNLMAARQEIDRINSAKAPGDAKLDDKLLAEIHEVIDRELQGIWGDQYTVLKDGYTQKKNRINEMSETFSVKMDKQGKPTISTESMEKLFEDIFQDKQSGKEKLAIVREMEKLTGEPLLAIAAGLATRESIATGLWSRILAAGALVGAVSGGFFAGLPGLSATALIAAPLTTATSPRLAGRIARNQAMGKEPILGPTLAGVNKGVEVGTGAINNLFNVGNVEQKRQRTEEQLIKNLSTIR